uniref:IQ motif containing with AAA domain 1 like n=1 Tax=Gopherus evgoodei TaxID=1825980 RepID=A0A8C4YAK9_9SAUR
MGPGVGACTYMRMWLESQAALKELLAQELPSQPPRSEKDQRLFFHMLATLFLRYTQILRCLETCYDQMVHPQKRRVLQHMLDGVMGRVLELKNEMVETELSEYHYMDDVLQDLKHADSVLPGALWLGLAMGRAGFVFPCAMRLGFTWDGSGHRFPSPLCALLPQPSRPAMLRDEAVQLVQMAERMRQGCLRSKFMWEIRRDEERERRARESGAKELDREQAAICIQKVTGTCPAQSVGLPGVHFFTGTPGRKGTLAVPVNTADRAVKVRLFRHLRQADYEAEYQQALVSIREGLYEVEGPDMREEMKEQLRQWFIECHDLTGRFPEFPDEEIGGSSILFAEKTPEQVSGQDTGWGAGANEPREEGQGRQSWEGQKQHLTCLPFPAATWGNWDESDNFEQRYEPELIKAQKRKEVEKELRLQVDELMREELQRLKLAVDREEGKARKEKKSSKVRGRVLTPGPPKARRCTHWGTALGTYTSKWGRGDITGCLCPPLPCRSRLPPPTGDFCYLGTTLRMAGIEPTPSVMDIRQNIALYAILRLGSPTLHEMAPLVKSVLLAGPAGTGKKMLVHAVCTETGANLFDLSPDNLVGKYPGKAGLSMLMHVVFKVARLMQPSVIWIGNAEKIFYKKVPKEEKQADPKRLKRGLPKALKLLKPEDRVLLIGTSDKPYAADVKTLCKAYERILLLPRPDYASRYVTWQCLIKKHGGTITAALDVSALAKLSDGYSQGHMVRAVQMALTERRLLQMPKKPLRAGEFLQLLAKADPIYSEEEKTLQVPG